MRRFFTCVFVMVLLVSTFSLAEQRVVLIEESSADN